MFPPLPDFEKLSLRIEVEHGGRERVVNARLLGAPVAKQVLLTFCFEDVRAEDWVVINSKHSTHHLNTERVFKVKCEHIGPIQRHFSRILTQKTINRLIRLVRNALAGRGLAIAPLFDFQELSHEPRIAILVGTKAIWYWYDKLFWATPFHVPFSSFDVSWQQARAHLLAQWHVKESDARFAWEWPQWSHDERILLCCGAKCDLGEMKRVMRWVLLCRQSIWEKEVSCEWDIYPGQNTQSAFGSARCWYFNSSEWEELLQRRCVPNWHAEWLTRYECVRQFWGRVGVLQSVHIARLRPCMSVLKRAFTCANGYNETRRNGWICLDGEKGRVRAVSPREIRGLW